MEERRLFLTTLEGIEKPIEWSELNRLKKDILWVYDVNVKDLNAAFIPDIDFKEKYWEYLTLEGNLDGEENFYKEGVMVIVLCMIVEYIDTTGGNQDVFGESRVSEVIEYIRSYTPLNKKQQMLKDILLQGLKIAASMTPWDLINTNEYEHPELERFFSKMPWISETFIEEYYRQKLNI